MSTLRALALTTLTACGSAPSPTPDMPVVFALAGVRVHASRSVNQAEFAYTLAAEAQYLQWLGGQYATFDSFGSVDIYLLDTPPVLATGEEVGGATYTDTARIEVYYHGDCLAETTLQHELSHWARFRVQGDADGGHHDGRFFSPSSVTSETFQAETFYCKAPAAVQSWLSNSLGPLK